MKYIKLRQSGIMFTILITIISFIYTINIRPVVIGEQGLIRNCSPIQDSFKFQQSRNDYRLYRVNLSFDFLHSIYIKNVFQKISSNIIKINTLNSLTGLKIEKLLS